MRINSRLNLTRNIEDSKIEKYFLKFVVSKLRTCITTPEEEILSQGTFGDDMYFISKGDCVVSIVDQNRQL